MTSQRSSFINNKSAGFTLIELIVGLVMIAATASTVFYGISYARAEVRKIAIRERALEELTGYMDYWIALINYGTLSVTDVGGDRRGEEVVIYNPTGDPQEVIIGKIYRESLTRHYSEEFNPSNHPYYFLRCKIVWVDHLAKDEIAEIYLEAKPFSYRP